MICMEGLEGLEVVTVNDKVREVEGGVLVEEGPGDTSGPTLPGSEGGLDQSRLITRYLSSY